jgi:hypothetical protein
VAAGAFGFLIFNHALDGPDLYGASNFFETNALKTEMADGSKHLVTVALCHHASGSRAGTVDEIIAGGRRTFGPLLVQFNLLRFPGGLRRVVTDVGGSTLERM